MSAWPQISRTVAPADSLALITLEQAKLVLGIAEDDTSQDAIVQAQIDAVSAGICDYCDRQFVVQTYRDLFTYPCTGYGDPLRARQYPIEADAAGVPTLFTVTVDGNIVDPTTYELDAANGRVYMLDSGWAGARIILDYTAGFDPIPPSVQAAANEWLTARWMGRGRDPGLQSETVFEVGTTVYSAGGSGGAGEGGEGPPPGVSAWLVNYRIWYL